MRWIILKSIQKVYQAFFFFKFIISFFQGTYHSHQLGIFTHAKANFQSTFYHADLAKIQRNEPHLKRIKEWCTFWMQNTPSGSSSWNSDFGKKTQSTFEHLFTLKIDNAPEEIESTSIVSFRNWTLARKSITIYKEW